MKICFVASTYPKHETDGSARFIRSLAESVADWGHEVHVLIPYRSDLNLRGNRVLVHTFRYTWSTSLEVMGYASAMHSDTRLRPLSYMLAPTFAVSEAAALLNLQRQHQFDVIHAHWIVPNGVIAAGVAQLTNRPLVVSLHGSDIFVAKRNTLLGAFAARAFRRCAAVTACSPELEAGALALHADPQKLRLIAWGADPNIFQGAVEKRLALRRHLGLSPSQPVILSLGRLVRKKGIADLIQAMPQVLAVMPNAVCLVAGDGSERSHLEALVQSLGVAQQVQFLGQVAWPTTPDLLAACDVFVVPSIHDENGNVDGLPTTIPEAMAAGRPVIATRVAGVELAIEHGVHGLLVTEKDITGLAQSLILVLSQPQVGKALGDNAHRRVVTSLNWREVARQFVTIYQESLGNAQS
jgi:glycosyltransferase involved in cell wall biosynthesis